MLFRGEIGSRDSCESPVHSFRVEERFTQQVVREGGKLKLRSQQIGVEVLAGPGTGAVRELSGPEVRIGSGSLCDLVIPDSTVSRHHLTLRVDDNGLRVLDSGSRNQTYLDGVRVRDAYAKPGTVLELGNTRLRLRLLTAVSEVPLSTRTQFGALLGQSVAMRQLFGLLERVAPAEATVLIEGETGSGKELVAEALHEESLRADRPFVVFDCAAVSPSLIESELFGHVKGAFTGAVGDRAGAFERADGGTLFIDEVGELPIELQPKLLRALEQRRVRRVGADAVRTVDVRILAATNRSLANEVDGARFREDLYYRLAVVRVSVPPLRERLDDIPLLVTHFHKQLVERGQTRRDVTPKLLRSLQEQSWPGNVRELRNALEAAMATGATESTDVADAPPPAPRGAIDISVTFRDAADGFERAYVAEVLKATGGNVTQAAEIAGCNRKVIQGVIKRYSLRKT